ncbi:YeiH family protein [Caldalkalibacillus mannanilyticus]|uniref:YeiH family protein n=1 Tax=Caldalkalibacillus mannanilyticus TaxID=1418 RepID=UPI00046AD78A|nr:putative sulfate exporter family transporter [Caldalkalibacillus mannanilyticus]
MLYHPTQIKNKTAHWKQQQILHFFLGLMITLLLAGIAQALALLPYIKVMGAMVIAIFLGIAWKALVPLPLVLNPGISFSSKQLLRLGIVLLGIRFDYSKLVHVKLELWLLVMFNVLATILIVYFISRWLKIENKLSILIACGTAICGAAAILAIASQIRAKQNEILTGTVTVAVVGTLFTLLYTLVYPYTSWSPAIYGIFAGATLHEMANVLAAAAPAGEHSEDIAVFVKLTRVAMLVPISLIVGVLFGRMERKQQKKPSPITLDVPWYVFGFIGVSLLHSIGIIPTEIESMIVFLSYLFLAMSMVALGLGIDLVTLVRNGLRTVIAVLIGSVFLAIMTFLFICYLG